VTIANSEAIHSTEASSCSGAGPFWLAPHATFHITQDGNQRNESLIANGQRPWHEWRRSSLSSIRNIQGLKKIVIYQSLTDEAQFKNLYIS
jgi:hypothetical protein